MTITATDVHASNRLGYTVCGAQDSGREQCLTEKYPSLWEDVTCEGCKAKEMPARILDAKNRCASDRPSLVTLRTMYVGIV